MGQEGAGLYHSSGELFEQWSDVYSRNKKLAEEKASGLKRIGICLRSNRQGSSWPKPSSASQQGEGWVFHGSLPHSVTASLSIPKAISRTCVERGSSRPLIVLLETRSHVAQSGDLLLHLPGAGITGMKHHAWLQSLLFKREEREIWIRFKRKLH